MPRARPSDQDLRDAVRSAGLRATRGRIAVLAAVLESDTPVSHAELCHLLGRGVDRATVFRNLNDLARAGLLRRFDVDHVWRFERQRTHAQSEHPHFVCTDCGKVECLAEVEVNIAAKSRMPASLATRQVEVQLRGVCDACV